METANEKYYTGFEGEPEVYFISKKGENTKKLGMWEGYFDDIMQTFEPTEKGWTGLAYYYNLVTGWNDEDIWRVEDTNQTLRDFQSIKKNLLKWKESSDVVDEICSLFTEAIEIKANVFIARD